MKLGRPTELRIIPEKGGTEFRFLLQFPGRPQSVEFDTSADDAMTILWALQQVQARHRIPMPEQLRPSGKPKLRVVSDEEKPP